MTSSKPWTVYILKCANGALYTGVTTDLGRRVKQHRLGLGGRYTRAHGVKRLIWKEPGHNHSTALKREAQIKKLSRSQKTLLARQNQ